MQPFEKIDEELSSLGKTDDEITEVCSRHRAASRSLSEVDSSLHGLTSVGDLPGRENTVISRKPRRSPSASSEAVPRASGVQEIDGPEPGARLSVDDLFGDLDQGDVSAPLVTDSPAMTSSHPPAAAPDLAELLEGGPEAAARSEFPSSLGTDDFELHVSDDVVVVDGPHVDNREHNDDGESEEGETSSNPDDSQVKKFFRKLFG